MCPLGYKEISPNELESASKLIGKDWMLITADDGAKVNAMTASWGGLGVLWNKPVAFGFVRPQRHTFELVEEQERISLAFLDEQYREALRICGSKSGRDCDKLSEASLDAGRIDGVPIISQARLVLICRKLYADMLKDSAFVDRALLSHYEKGDLHKMYVWEIEAAYARE